MRSAGELLTLPPVESKGLLAISRMHFCVLCDWVECDLLYCS